MKYNKTQRILLLFHLFYYCQEVSIQEIIDYFSLEDISVSLKTFSRDILLLKNAGLVQVKYSKKDKAYIPLETGKRFVPLDGKYLAPKLSDNKSQRLYMEKIIRLCTLMTDMIMYEVENPIDWYRKRYPELSDRTRQRDFKQLREIGYKVSYAPADEEGLGQYCYEYPHGAFY